MHLSTNNRKRSVCRVHVPHWRFRLENLPVYQRPAWNEVDKFGTNVLQLEISFSCCAFVVNQQKEGRTTRAGLIGETHFLPLAFLTRGATISPGTAHPRPFLLSGKYAKLLFRFVDGMRTRQ